MPSKATSPGRLAALLRAGPYRLAIPAPAVQEVVQLAPGASELQGLALEPLAPLLGGAAGGGGWGLRLAAGQARAFRVDAVESVADLRDAPFFNLPLSLGVEPGALFRGVVQVGGGLALEASPEALLALTPPGPPRSPPPAGLSSEPAPKALVFTVAGRSMAFALTQVLSVVAQPAITPVPRVLKGRRGVTLHAQILYPVLDAGEVLFDRPTDPAFGVVVEQQGGGWVVLADAVRGVRDGFQPSGSDSPGWMESVRGERALFPLFPSDAGELGGVSPR